jgi:hypothetical protein
MRFDILTAEIVDSDLLVYDTLFCRCLQVFRRNLLPLASGRNYFIL